MSKLFTVILIAAIAIAFQEVAYADALDDAVEICRNPDWVKGVTAEEVEVVLEKGVIILTGDSLEQKIAVNELESQSQISKFNYLWRTIDQDTNIIVFLFEYGRDVFVQLNQPTISGGEPSCSRAEYRVS